MHHFTLQVNRAVTSRNYVYQHDNGFCLDLRNSLDLTYRIVFFLSRVSLFVKMPVYSKVSVADKERLYQAHVCGDDYVRLAEILGINRTTAYPMHII